MKTRQLFRSMSLTALFTVSVLLALNGWMIWAADSLAPSTLVGERFALTDTNGASSMITFAANSRYFLDKPAQNTNELGYFTATRAGDVWNVATTREDGRVTTQYTFTFTGAGVGQVVAVQAGRSRATNTFQEASIPARGLSLIRIQNESSIMGPAAFTIHLTNGATAGDFFIPSPGYGAGTFNFTPGTNTAKLFLTYTNADLIGDTDDLTLEFRAPSESPLPSRQSGTNRVSGVSYPVQGTFTYTTQ
jgi:hypothetical protein